MCRTVDIAAHFDFCTGEHSVLDLHRQIAVYVQYAYAGIDCCRTHCAAASGHGYITGFLSCSRKIALRRHAAVFDIHRDLRIPAAAEARAYTYRIGISLDRAFFQGAQIAGKAQHIRISVSSISCFDLFTGRLFVFIGIIQSLTYIGDKYIAAHRCSTCCCISSQLADVAEFFCRYSDILLRCQVTIRHITLHSTVDSINSDAGTHTDCTCGDTARISIYSNSVFGCHSNGAIGRCQSCIGNIGFDLAVDIIYRYRPSYACSGSGHTCCRNGRIGNCFIGRRNTLVAAAVNSTAADLGFCDRIVLQNTYG